MPGTRPEGGDRQAAASLLLAAAWALCYPLQVLLSRPGSRGLRANNVKAAGFGAVVLMLTGSEVVATVLLPLCGTLQVLHLLRRGTGFSYYWGDPLLPGTGRRRGP